MKPLLLLAALSAVALPAAGQASRTFERTLPLQLSLDHSLFAYDGQKQLVEVYVGVGGERLPFQAAPGGGFEALVPLILTFHPLGAADVPAEQPAWQDAARLRFTVPDTTQEQLRRQFVQVARAALPAGRYELRATVPAPDGGSPVMSLRQTLQVRAFPAPSLSEITLASAIHRSADPTDPFYHNGLSVQPHPSLVFGNTLPMLQYYAEVYGGAAASDTAYVLRTSVTPEGSSEAVAGLTREQRRAARPVDVVVGALNVRRLASGAYTLRLDAVGADGQVRAAQERRFHVYNPGIPSQSGPVAVAFEASVFAALPPDDVDHYLRALQAIGSEQEREQIRGITDLTARRRYLYTFWTARDPNPATPGNAGLEEFERRLQQAETRYGRGSLPGYRTDRGRALIKYGEPQDIERTPLSRNNELRSFEVWSYEGLPGIGQARFVFVDRRDTGNLEQVFSTVPGERGVAAWRCELSRLGKCDAIGDLGL